MGLISRELTLDPFGMPLTLRGVDEKPQNQSPDTFAVSGLFVLLHVDRLPFLLLGTK